MTSRSSSIHNLEFDELDRAQRLKAAVHYTVLQICRDVEADLDVTINKQLIAALSETTWRQCESFSQDLELFAKHAKRTTVNPDDVKMLVRKAPNLLQHISNMYEEKVKKDEPKKKVRKPKKNVSKTSTDVTIETDADSIVPD
ncbi:centromere protein S-like [Gigantopelta aegis]|uniref:centromere protein S-like n=1 Tax=Gigantopelta aegis TaxID=1735272 RepID=UPI001B88A7E2|nr:centromere protein S-like [Gigantopelta aegis]